MTKWTIYSKNGKPRCECVIGFDEDKNRPVGQDTLEYSGKWMGECFLTVSIKSPYPVDFQIGDYITYRGEKFTINYDPTVIKKARRGTYGEGFTYDSIKFNSLSNELTEIRFHDWVLNDNKYHYTSLPNFSFYCKDVDDLVDRLQANTNRYCKDNGFKKEDYWMFYTLRNNTNGTADRGQSQTTYERTVQRAQSISTDSTFVTNVKAQWEETYGTGDSYKDSRDDERYDRNITASSQSVWDMMTAIKQQFGLNFIIRGRNVYVGTAGVPTSHLFEYGKNKGLYEVDKTADTDQEVVTKLHAYGSDENLPTRYYADLGKQVGCKIKKIIQNTQDNDDPKLVFNTDLPFSSRYFYDVLESSVDADKQLYKVAIKLSSATVNGYVYADVDGNTEFLANKETEPNEANLKALMQEVAADAIIYFMNGVRANTFSSSYTYYIPTNLPDNMAVNNLMLPGFPNNSLADLCKAEYDSKTNVTTYYIRKDKDSEYIAFHTESGNHVVSFSDDKYNPYILSPNASELGIKEGDIFCNEENDDNGLKKVYPTIEEVTDVDAGTGSTGSRLDAVIKADKVEDNGVYPNDKTDNVKGFNIYIPNLGFDLKKAAEDAGGSDMKISMKNGYNGGRTFDVANCTKQDDGTWKLECKRTPDNDLDLYFPYSYAASVSNVSSEMTDAYQILPGDNYILTGIAVSDVNYVWAASVKLLRKAIHWLCKNDYTRYVYNPKIDEIYMARQDKEAKADGTLSLHDTLKEGDMLLFADDDLRLNGAVYIDQLNIKENGNNGIPTYDVTLRDEIQVGTLQRIQNQVDSIKTDISNGNIGGGNGGVSPTDVDPLVKSYGAKYFLSKLKDDTANGIISFAKGLLSKGKALFNDAVEIVKDLTVHGNIATEGALTTKEVHSPSYNDSADTGTGMGYHIWVNGTTSNMIIDNLTVRGKWTASVLEVMKLQYSAGNVTIDGAGGEIFAVEPYDKNGDSLIPADGVNPNLALGTSSEWSKWITLGDINQGWAVGNESTTLYRMTVPLSDNISKDKSVCFSIEIEFSDLQLNTEQNSYVQLQGQSKYGSITDWGLGTITEGDDTAKGQYHVSLLKDGVNRIAAWTYPHSEGNAYSWQIRADFATLRFRYRKIKVEYGKVATPYIANISETAFYRCYFKATDGDRHIENLWHVGDQVKCQTFNLTDGTYKNAANRLYFRVVKNVSSEVEKINGVDCWYIDLSNLQNDTLIADTAVGDTKVGDTVYYRGIMHDKAKDGTITWLTNDAPEKGDQVAHVGNVYDTARQGATQLIAVGETKGLVIYEGINETLLNLNSFAKMQLSPKNSFINTRFITFTNGYHENTPYIQCGDWVSGTTAHASEVWQHNGSSWICNKETSTEPSEGDDAWTVMAKQGKQGIPGEDGKDGASVNRNLALGTSSEWADWVTTGDVNKKNQVASYRTPLSETLPQGEDVNISIEFEVEYIEGNNNIQIKGNNLGIIGYVNFYVGRDEKIQIDYHFQTSKESNIFGWQFQVDYGVAKFRYRCLKLERGSVATAYIPNEADLKGDQGDAATSYYINPEAVLITERVNGITFGDNDTYTAKDYTYDIDHTIAIHKAVGNADTIVKADSISVIEGGKLGLDTSKLQASYKDGTGYQLSSAITNSGLEGDTTINKIVVQFSWNGSNVKLNCPIYINRLGTVTTQTVGDATQTVRRKVEADVNPSIEAAQKAAGNASDAAQKAQDTANSASTAASNAQSAANTAQTTAQNAANKASTAQGAADKAQGAADSAQKAANANKTTLDTYTAKTDDNAKELTIQRTKLERYEYDYRNLLVGSDLSDVSKIGGEIDSAHVSDTVRFGGQRSLHVKGKANNYFGIFFVPIAIKHNTKYHVSVWVKGTGNFYTELLYKKAASGKGKDRDGHVKYFNTTTLTSADWTRYDFDFTTDENHDWIECNFYTIDGNTECWMSNFMLEEGDACTGWTPNVNDTAAEYRLSSEIKQNAQQISLNVLEVDNVKKGLTNTGIDITNGKITSKADNFEWNDNSGNPIARFDSANGATFSGNVSAKTLSTNSGKSRIDEDGILHAEGADLNGTLTTNEGTTRAVLSGGGLQMFDNEVLQTEHTGKTFATANSILPSKDGATISIPTNAQEVTTETVGAGESKTTTLTLATFTATANGVFKLDISDLHAQILGDVEDTNQHYGPQLSIELLLNDAKVWSDFIALRTYSYSYVLREDPFSIKKFINAGQKYTLTLSVTIDTISQSSQMSPKVHGTCSVTLQSAKIASDSYLSMFFGNGLMFAKDYNHYIISMLENNIMKFEARNGNNGVCFDGDGIKMLASNGSWYKQPIEIGFIKVLCDSTPKIEKSTIQGLSISRSTKGCFDITFPSSLSSLKLGSNGIIMATGYTTVNGNDITITVNNLTDNSVNIQVAYGADAKEGNYIYALLRIILIS